MAFLLDKLISARRFLFHLTTSENLVHIRQTALLKPAAALMRRAKRIELLRARRSTHVPSQTGKRSIVLRDQSPLHRRNVELLDGFGFEDFVESLNNRVFFWPGKDGGPSDYGVRHFERYENEHPVILRVGFRSLVAANPSAKPLFCAYNSGSPRCYMGNKSPRGPNTFLEAQRFAGTLSEVVEVTFEREILLPSDTEYAQHPTGKWRTLFG